MVILIVDIDPNAAYFQTASLNSSPGCVDKIEELPGPMKCFPISQLTNITSSHRYSEITLSACKKLCQTLHDWKCSRIYFFPLSRTCVLTPRINFLTVKNDETCYPAVIYNRTRCLGKLILKMSHFEPQTEKYAH